MKEQPENIFDYPHFDDDGTEPRGTQEDFDKLEAEIIRESARRMGSIRSERKAQTARENVAKARAAKGEPKPCTCNKTPHSASCPVGHRERVAKYAANKKAKA